MSFSGVDRRERRIRVERLVFRQTANMDLSANFRQTSQVIGVRRRQGDCRGVAYVEEGVTEVKHVLVERDPSRSNRVWNESKSKETAQVWVVISTRST